MGDWLQGKRGTKEEDKSDEKYGKYAMVLRK